MLNLPQVRSIRLSIVPMSQKRVESQAISREKNESFSRGLDWIRMWGHAMNDRRMKMDIENRS